MAYKFLQQNITLALPSLRTVQRHVYSEYSVMSEGEFRFDKSSDHIKRYQLSGIVTIGEDATRVIHGLNMTAKLTGVWALFYPLLKMGFLSLIHFWQHHMSE